MDIHPNVSEKLYPDVEKIKELMVSRKLTASALQRQVSFSRSYMSKLLNGGTKQISRKYLTEIAAALNVQVQELVKDSTPASFTFTLPVETIPAMIGSIGDAYHQGHQAGMLEGKKELRIELARMMLEGTGYTIVSVEHTRTSESIGNTVRRRRID